MIDPQQPFDLNAEALDHLSRLAGLHRALETAVEPLFERAAPDEQRVIDALMHAANRETCGVERLLMEACKSLADPAYRKGD